MDIIMKPIGYIKSEFTRKEDLPKQSILNPDKKAFIKIQPEYIKGLEEIKKNDHIIIIFNFHKSNSSPLQTVSRRDNKETGVFNTRSPNRPNGIGLSIVEVIEVSDNRLAFKGVDMLDGTPVLDIKPYSSDLNPKDI